MRTRGLYFHQLLPIKTSANGVISIRLGIILVPFVFDDRVTTSKFREDASVLPFNSKKSICPRVAPRQMFRFISFSRALAKPLNTSDCGSTFIPVHPLK